MNVKACMYLRLSREDGDSSESNSISNQREIIKTFAKSRDIEVVKEFVDDGFSGSNFNRPSFKEMMIELENKSFNTIIVKDLSRFGRDYIESGKYLQKVFPEKRVRFISVNDGYDSFNADTSDTHLILPIRNFINDSYCRDISMKVKSSKDIKRRKGEYLSSFAPFGYKKDPKDKHKLIVDENVSNIIERIFYMKVEGYSSKAIADFLNSIGTITPGKYREETSINTNGFTVRSGKWDAKMINRIIENKVYIGTIEQGKTSKLNYKSTKIIDVNKEDWIVTHNAHEPIITKNNFLIANKMLYRDLISKGMPNLFSGMLFCEDCGRQMVRRVVRRNGKENIYYICSSNNKDGSCSRHSIKEEVIEKNITLALRRHTIEYNAILEQVRNVDLEKIEYEIDLTSLEKEKEKYIRLRASLYHDLEDELISNSEFDKFRKNYLVKIKDIDKQIENKRELATRVKENLVNLDKFEILSECNSLDRLTLVMLVDKIYIKENGSIEILLNKYEEIILMKKLLETKKEEITHKKNIISIHEGFSANKVIDNSRLGGVVING